MTDSIERIEYRLDMLEAAAVKLASVVIQATADPEDTWVDMKASIQAWCAMFGWAVMIVDPDDKEEAMQFMEIMQNEDWSKEDDDDEGEAD